MNRRDEIRDTVIQLLLGGDHSLGDAIVDAVRISDELDIVDCDEGPTIVGLGDLVGVDLESGQMVAGVDLESGQMVAMNDAGAAMPISFPNAPFPRHAVRLLANFYGCLGGR